MIKSILERFLPQLAKLARARRQRVLLGIGIMATIGAVALNVASNYLPEFPDRTRDLILKWRLSSPAPSDSVVILDIDERSLSLLSDEHGRWPWSRAVLAQGLQMLAEKEAKAILFNVLITDPDINNEEGDLQLELTTQLIPNAVYPIVRLNPDSDEGSDLMVSALPGASLLSGEDKKIAAILPLFESMFQNGGVNNQHTDRDGVIRSYSRIWEEDTFTLPSIVQRLLSAGRYDTTGIPQSYALNWRNKNGRYERVSFGDFFQNPNSPEITKKFKDAWVVLSVSAPGIGQTKPTAVAPVEDDAEILATVIDDAISGTYLREIPDELLLLLNITVVWILIILALRNRAGKTIDKIFVLSQGSLAAIMYLSASYTNFYLDFGDNISFALGVFGGIKVVQALDDKWMRAAKGYRKSKKLASTGKVALLGYPVDIAPEADRKVGYLEKEVENIVGLDSVLRIDDLFGGQSLVHEVCESVTIILCWVEPGEQKQLQELIDQTTHIHHIWCSVANRWDVTDPVFAREIAPQLLNFSAVLLTNS